MKTVNINGHECIFDSDMDTTYLTVHVNNRDGYKRVVYTNTIGVRRRKLASMVFARIIMNTPKKLQCDHINGNSLDCRRENLRNVTARQNSMNKANQLRKESLPRGVFRSKNGNKFRARLRIRGWLYYLGTFDTPEEAHEVYVRELNKMFGEHSIYNSRK